MSAPFFYAKLKFIMSDEEQKKPEKPYRMSRVAWPNSRYGLYLAIIIIIGFLLIVYNDIIF